MAKTKRKKTEAQKTATPSAAEPRVVRNLATPKNATGIPQAPLEVGKSQRVVTGVRSVRSGFRGKVAAACGPSGVGGSGGVVGGGSPFGVGGGGSAGFLGNSGAGAVAQASGGNFYSPELSTDFLELPQSLNEQWNYFRFFYNNEPFVGQAIDLHTELPLSKVRLQLPEAKSREMAEDALRFCEKWANRVGLLQRLIEIIHEFHLIGEVYIFCEDANKDMPDDIRYQTVRRVQEDGTLVEDKVEYEDAADRAVEWLSKNYKGWTNIRIFPPENIHIETYPFTDEAMIQLIPDSKTKHLIGMADQGDVNAERIVKSMDNTVVNAVRSGENITLNTDPDAGSFVHYMANKKSQYEPRGHSILQRCLLPGTLMTVLRDGIVQQVAVEDVDTENDRLLTHKGRFRAATKGSRPVDETVSVLSFEGTDRTLAVTQEHEILVIREDGTEAWVRAGDLMEGDVVRESHILPKDPIREIDLGSWWRNKTLSSHRRRRANVERRVRILQVVEVDNDEGLSVTFCYDNDNAGQQIALQDMRAFLGWLQSFEGPVSATYAEIAVLAGINKSKVRNYAHQFRAEYGLRTERQADGSVLWWGLPKTLKLNGEQQFVTLTSPVSKITLDRDFCYLLGTWMGDGSVWASDESWLNTPLLSWSSGRGELEQKIKSRTMELASRYLGSQTKNGLLFGKLEETDSFRVEDELLARFFMEEFGHSAQGKHLPEWFFHLPDPHVEAFLRGLLDTDGSLHLNPEGASTISFEMDNRRLLEQVHLLCNRLRIKTQVRDYTKPAHTWDRSWDTKEGRREKTYHYEDKVFTMLYASRHTDVRRWAHDSIKGAEAVWFDKDHPNANKASAFQGLWLTRKIKKVSTLPYKGLVYSFGVEEDESHVTNGIVTHNCLRTLVFFDKVRQAQTSIASRHMTPVRLVYAANMSAADTDDLRLQIDLALQDPDYSVITNFQVTWEEMGANGRLLELSGEYDMVSRQLYAGLGVTEALLSGESSYSGDRINLEVINTRYMLLRENIQKLVEERFFKPMCRRMGFVEKDDDGQMEVIYPKLSFTRLALRDNQDTFDALFQLYHKGSLDIETILDLLNIDPVTVKDRLKKDFATFNDAQFNEVLRAMYSRAGDELVQGSDLVSKIADQLGLTYKKSDPNAMPPRFASRVPKKPKKDTPEAED